MAGTSPTLNIPIPRVSVVTPFYDTAPEFMCEAIESVLAQSFPAWELLLVDDGSSGPCTAVARRHESEHGRVRYLEHPGHENRGLSASRNLGIERARGEYVAFLDADDVWLPNKLEEQVTLLDRHPEAGMLYGNTLYWYSWSGEAGDEEKDFVPDLGVPAGLVVPPPHLLPLLLSGRAAVPCTCSVLARREVVSAVGGFVESARGLYEDQVFYAKMCLHYPVLVADACWDRYRQHGGSLCGSASKEKERGARRTFLGWLESYLVDEGIEDPAVWGSLRRERWKNRHPSVARILRMGGRLARRAIGAGPARRRGH